ncbi:ABC1 kinase family protein [Thermodesulfobacteriota bacterium]
MFRINQTYRNINRLRHILIVFIKHGFYRFIEDMDLVSLIPLINRLRKKDEKEVETSAIPKRLRMVFEELGPAFVKLGQMLSTRPDLVPADFVIEFKKLQDEAPLFDLEVLKNIIEEELKYPLDILFSSFDEKPIAAASIAQVHRATFADGTELIVKVQRPGIEKTIKSDISILYILAGLLVKYFPGTKLYNPLGIVDEFAKAIQKELNFVIEASNAERMARYFAGDSTLVIPRVFWEYTTQKVLVTRFVDGISIDNIKRLKDENYDLDEIANNSINIFLKQVLVHGYFHGDLHPGNILVLEGNKICLIDFGIVGRINKKMMESVATIFVASLKEDYDAIAEEYVDMGILDETIDIEDFKRDLRDMLEPYYGRSLKNINTGAILFETIQVCIKHNIKIQKEFILLSRSIMTLEGVARQISPDFNMLEEGKPFIKSLFLQRLSPRRISNDTYKSLKEVSQFFNVFPRQLKILLKKMITDKFSIEFKHKGLDDLLGEIDRASNRISFSLVISALIIGSSLVMNISKGPVLGGLSILGIFGYCMSGLLAFILAFLIIRSGKF